MPIRATASAKNLRDQLKRSKTELSNKTSNADNVHTTTDGASRANTLDPATRNSLSRSGSLLRTVSGGGGSLRRVKSFQRKGKDLQNSLPDLSMDVTLLIVRRCVKEIRERGKWTVIL
ncbi:hypothetical protein BGZ49_010370 [Haplosporangium sp. Z 27]|nr:hypothetical protein BGZ49_010370 [Haplosporangium sp. Z 27]